MAMATVPKKSLTVYANKPFLRAPLMEITESCSEIFLF